MSNNGITRTVLRIPDDLYEKVKDIAENEKRSINNQILVIIEEWIKVKAGE